MAEFKIEGTRFNNGVEREFLASVEADSKLQARIKFLVSVGQIEEKEVRKIRDARDYDIEEWVEEQQRDAEFRIEGVSGEGVEIST